VCSSDLMKWNPLAYVITNGGAYVKGEMV